MDNFELKPIANGNTGLYVNNKFAGLYSNGEIIQFSSNIDQLFCTDTCVKFLVNLFPEKVIYSYITAAGNQQYLRVSIRNFPIEDGVKIKHNDTANK